ncbi:MAG: nucleotidyltransferase domain-containing protein [Candidatus Cloacimonadota bacterium]|nr:nucleotidyltransferase domain-containing protein [Candidatus Cloacimonadota bacterium]
MLKKRMLDEIVLKIVNNYKPEKLLLFGSYASETETESSDLDLLVIKNNNLPRYKRSREVRAFLRGILFPMDIIVYTPEEIKKWKNVKHSFIHNVLNSCEVLYEREI